MNPSILKASHHQHSVVFSLVVLGKLALAASGAALLWTGLIKSVGIGEFIEIVSSHAVFPEYSVAVLATAFVVSEILVGVLALWSSLGEVRRCLIGSAAVAVFLLSLTVYAAILSFYPPPAPTSCGCTGSMEVIESWVPVLKRNAWLTMAAALMTLGWNAISGKQQA